MSAPGTRNLRPEDRAVGRAAERADVRGSGRGLLILVVALLAAALVVQVVLLTSRDRLPGPGETAGDGAPGVGEIVSIDGLDLVVQHTSREQVRIRTADDDGTIPWTRPVLVVRLLVSNDGADPVELLLDGSYVVTSGGMRYGTVEGGMAHAVAAQPYDAAVTLNPAQSTHVDLVLDRPIVGTIDHLRLVGRTPGPDGAPREVVVRLDDE